MRIQSFSAYLFTFTAVAAFAAKATVPLASVSVNVSDLNQSYNQIEQIGPSSLSSTALVSGSDSFGSASSFASLTSPAVLVESATHSFGLQYAVANIEYFIEVTGPNNSSVPVMMTARLDTQFTSSASPSAYGTYAEALVYLAPAYYQSDYYASATACVGLALHQ